MSDNRSAIAVRPRRVLLLGATGTIGRATAHELVRCGHDVACLVRRPVGEDTARAGADVSRSLDGAEVRFGDVTDPQSLTRDAFRGEPFDAVVSCLASRTGVPHDAWAIDHRAHVTALQAARAAGVDHFVLLSAICVQKPLLEFQRAKLAFEAELIKSGLTYSIVRPTAFFKSLSGQVERVKAGRPFLVFGDGRLTACKPISDHDLARYIAGCLDDGARHNKILPIGGPGPAITPMDQAEHLFRLLNTAPRIRHVPVALLDGIVGTLGALGRISPAMAQKAELARIGRYYATQSMLVLDPETGRYDADATPSFGTETLFGYYDQLISGRAEAERGDHVVF